MQQNCNSLGGSQCAPLRMHQGASSAQLHLVSASQVAVSSAYARTGKVFTDYFLYLAQKWSVCTRSPSVYDIFLKIQQPTNLPNW